MLENLAPLIALGEAFDIFDDHQINQKQVRKTTMNTRTYQLNERDSAWNCDQVLASTIRPDGYPGKTLCLVIIAWAILGGFALRANAQGLVRFANLNVEAGIDHPINHVLCENDAKFEGDRWVAQLFFAFPGSAPDTFVAIGQPAPFLTGALAGYWTSSDIQIPGIGSSQEVQLQVRIWDRDKASTYEEGVSLLALTATSESWTQLTGPDQATPAPLTGFNGVVSGGPLERIPLSIRSHPSDHHVPIGTTVVFSVEVEHMTDVRYQWFRSGQPIEDATAASLAVLVQIEDFEDAFSVVVTDECGESVNSNAARIYNPVVWQEDWESPSASDVWFADLGYWEIGVPTSGPPNRGDGFRTHQGTNCAATVLNGNYTDDRNSRLVSSLISVPSTDENPRLRFWHWWSFNDDDYGQVQISTNNGASWEALSPRYGDGSPAVFSSSGAWTQAWLDLTPYAGEAVRFGLYFFSHNGSGNGGSVDVSSGWYIDEFVVESGALEAFNPSEGFEDAAALDRWAANYGVWEIGTTPSNGSGPTGDHFLATNLSGNYTDDRRSFITSQPYELPAAKQNPRLRFWHWWSFQDNDYGSVWITTNNAASWIELSPKYGDGSPANFDSSGGWTRAWLDLIPYAGLSVKFGLYFFSQNGPANGGSVDVSSGWYIDDFIVETGPLATFDPSDDFEDSFALNRWFANYGVWEIGEPTSGPPSVNGSRAHSGTKCLATKLIGNYTDDRSSSVFSQRFVVPPAETNPRLRFWHWWNFNDADFGRVAITTNNGTSWINLATYTTSSPWTQSPPFDLSPYAGETMRIGFYFFSKNGSANGGSIDVAPGWYIDDVSLVHDPALLLTGSPVVRTEDMACVSLQIAVNLPTSGASFLIESPAGNLSDPVLTTEGCWSGTITVQADTRWLVDLQSTCPNGSAGVESIGTICFTAVSSQSAFVPLNVTHLIINDLTPVQAYGSRSVNIANEPLVESWLDSNGNRMVTLFGKANTDYEILQSADLSVANPWQLGWTSSVPTNLFIHVPVQGSLSNAPILFLNASEP